MIVKAASGATAKHAKFAKAVGRQGRCFFFASFACFVVGISPALAIPVEIHEGDIALTVPEGFEEITPLTNESDVVRLFARHPSPSAEPDTWLTIRRAPVTTGTVSDATTDTNSGILGRYSERLHGFDIAVLQKRLTSNDAVYLQSRAQIPAGANALLVDLKSRALEDHEMKDLMRTVLASAAARPAENQETFNWGPMFLCLALAAALIILACARR